MPISAENRARYPKDWPQIRARIQERAGNKCEQCGVPNGAVGGRNGYGAFIPAEPLPDGGMPEPGLWAMCDDGKDDFRLRLRIIRIVCTTAHLDHTPENCSDDNLRFWCQKCHLAYDHEHHQHNAAETRRKGKAAADLFVESSDNSA